jgi:predicted small lipoprotein YifL
MKRTSFLVFLASLVIAALLLQGCGEKGELTLLFTSDVKGWLVPAG